MPRQSMSIFAIPPTPASATKNVRRRHRRRVDDRRFRRAPYYFEPAAPAGDPFAGCGAFIGCGATFTPGASASCPVTTTVSSGFTPSSITIMSPSWRWPGLTARCSTVLSGLTTNTNGPLLTDLDGLRRHQFRAGQLVENQTHAHEFAGPKHAVGIRRNAARFHRARARLDGVVDEIKIAHERAGVVVGRIGLHFHIRPAEITAHLRHVVFRDGEIGVDRIKLFDREQICAARVSAGDNIANIDRAQSGAAVDRRTNVAIIKVHLRRGRCRRRFARVRLSRVDILW